MKGLDKEYRKRKKNEQTEATKVRFGLCLAQQTPPLTDEEDARYDHDSEQFSRDTTPTHHATPVSASQSEQTYRSMGFIHPQTLPSIPDSPPFSVPPFSNS